MADSGDKLTRRYRSLAREQPPAALDRAILDQARAAARPRRYRWMVPVSIAAILVLGIGVSLRMQLEQPGVETAAPASEYQVPPPAAPASEYSVPPAAEPATAPAEKATPLKRETASPPPRPFADESFKAQQSVPATPPAPAFVPAPAPAPAPQSVPPPAAPAAVAGAQAPAAAPQSAPLRAKREAASMDSLGARELRKSVAPEADPGRELERIAKLRASGDDAEADKALAEFRRRHPDFRIPEAMWERVKPR